MSYTELVLKSKQAREAIDTGILAFLLTGDLQEGWNVMIRQGKKNLSYPALKLAIFLDVVKAITK